MNEIAALPAAQKGHAINMLGEDKMRIEHRPTKSSWEVYVDEGACGFTYEYNNYCFDDLKVLYFKAIIKTIADDYHKLEISHQLIDKPSVIKLSGDFDTLNEAMSCGFEDIKKFIDIHKQRFSSSEKS